MAAVTVGTTPEVVYTSTSGSASFPDTVDIRLADEAGTVYLTVGGIADPDESIFITGSQTFTRNLKAGQYISAVTSAGTEELRIEGSPDGAYGA